MREAAPVFFPPMNTPPLPSDGAPAAARLAAAALALGATALHAAAPALAWEDARWKLALDPASGALVRIENPADPQPMNWLRGPGRWERGKWLADTSPDAVSAEGQWGLVRTAQLGPLHAARVRRVSERVWESVYTGSVLTVTVRRELEDDGGLLESYTFENTGGIQLRFPVGSLSLSAPLFDQYPNAIISQAARCHAHLWMGGTSAWINAIRMGARPPHLGLVLVKGSLDAYSIQGATYNDRGVFLLHPAEMKLDGGQRETIAWRLFWHEGWDDFWTKLAAVDRFVRLSATDYSLVVGDKLEITAESASSLANAQLFANGERVDCRLDETGRLRATIPATRPGEILVELRDQTRKTWLRANVTPGIDRLIEARLRFILRHQQRNAPGDPLDGAYLSYDNETGRQIYSRTNDHNAGRERTAMGVLGALYLPRCRDEALKAELAASLARYAAFVDRELQDESGEVYNDVGRSFYDRLYNFPWAAHFHLALYRATGDGAQLDRFVRVVRRFYARGGAKHYAIGLPVTEGLRALAEAGRADERAELLARFREHADQIVRFGGAYPSFEVNYEQSIVAPGVQLLAEVYIATGEESYLKELRRQMPVLEAFAGRQPDHRLNEVSIRHWDDYWFGKLGLYGDTFPHYWSVLNARAYASYGRITGESGWLARAEAVAGANLSLFQPDGRASCAHLYALTSNGQPAARNDPWANDQDWALVHWLVLAEDPAFASGRRAE